MKTIYLYGKTGLYSLKITATTNRTAPKNWFPIAIVEDHTKMLPILNFLPPSCKPPTHGSTIEQIATFPLFHKSQQHNNA